MEPRGLRGKQKKKKNPQSFDFPSFGFFFVLRTRQTVSSVSTDQSMNLLNLGCCCWFTQNRAIRVNWAGSGHRSLVKHHLKLITVVASVSKLTTNERKKETWQKRDRIPFSWKVQQPRVTCGTQSTQEKRERGGERLARILLLISKGVLAAAAVAAAVAFWLL